MSNDKEVNGISKNKVQKASKHKNQGQEMDQKVKSDQKNESNSVLYMDRNVENARRKKHWANCCYTKKVHEASAASSDHFVLDEVTTSKEKKTIEVFVIMKINNKNVKAKLDIVEEVNPTLLRIYKQTETDAVQMRKTATKLCGYGGANIPVVGTITVKCKFCDAEELSQFYIVKTDNKTLLSLQTCKSLTIIQKSNHKSNMFKQKRKCSINQMDEMNQK